MRLRTATERIRLLDLAGIRPGLSGITPLAIQQRCDAAFDVEAVMKDFFREAANWYFWALRSNFAAWCLGGGTLNCRHVAR